MLSTNKTNTLPLSEAELSEAFRVQDRSLQNWLAKVKPQHERLVEVSQGVMNRYLRMELDQVVKTIGEIIENCETIDRDDIREEIVMGALVERFVNNIDEYATHVAVGGMTNDQTRLALEAVEKLILQKKQWAIDLLDRMKSNDGEDLKIRTKVLSSVFRHRDKS